MLRTVADGGLRRRRVPRVGDAGWSRSSPDLDPEHPQVRPAADYVRYVPTSGSVLPPRLQPEPAFTSPGHIESRAADEPANRPTTVEIGGRRLPTSEVFDTYWRFAAARNELYLSRLAGEPAPWTDDPILRDHRFTNVFRAADRVSQYLIREVIFGQGLPNETEEVVFRVLLFKMFNKIQTWEALVDRLGPLAWSEFDFNSYCAVLDEASTRGPVYSAAYMIPPPRLGESRKHANHLRLLSLLMSEGFSSSVAQARTLAEVFDALVAFPSMGRFLAFQFTIDLNYSDVIDFDEDDYVVAGPGAADGIRKCFGPEASGFEAQLIRYMVDSQDEHFARLGLRFDGLFGRKLHLIDAQNLFCEVDKYARVAHPEVPGISGRTRIKQKYRSNAEPLEPWFPPSWGLNPRQTTSTAPAH